MTRARRRTRADLAEAGQELRVARVGRGWSLREVARRCGLSPSTIGRIERGEHRRVTFEDLATIGATVGVDVRLRSYPGPDPTMDAGQLAVFQRLRRIVAPSVTMPTEVGLPIEGDQRAWDAVMRGLVGADGAATLAVDIETRLIDGQRVLRRVALKRRDSGAEAVLLVLADTHANRRALRECAPLLEADYPIPPRAALAALRAGRHPGGSAVILI